MRKLTNSEINVIKDIMREMFENSEFTLLKMTDKVHSGQNEQPPCLLMRKCSPHPPCPLTCM